MSDAQHKFSKVKSSKKKKGLSPSSLSLYLSCPRKYWHKKVNETPIEEVQDTEALDIGKAFHWVLETKSHNLNGLRYQEVIGSCLDHNLTEDYAPMIFSMLSSYKEMHENSGLSVIACEIEVETKSFYGFVDAVMLDENGGWWIVDMKTSASYSKMLQATIPRHLQLNLYADNANVIADKLNLSLKDFEGVRYRLTTKSKLKRKDGEGVKDYLGRLSSVIKSYDFPVQVSDLDMAGAAETHEWVSKAIGKRKKEASSFVCNFNNCTQYYRACEYFKHCHGREFFEA